MIRNLFIGCSLILATAAWPANATVITYNFTGIWDEAFEPTDHHATLTVPGAGDPFSGFVIIDTDQPGVIADPAHPTLSLKYLGERFSITTAGHEYGTSLVRVQVLVDTSTNGYWIAEPAEAHSFDVDGVEASESSNMGGYVFLFDGDKSSLSIEADITEYSTRVALQIILEDAIGRTTDRFNVLGHLTSFSMDSLPAPATLPLVVTGLVALSLMRWRRNRRFASS